jgi:BirA family transcriptional regulator, biotin operon repressor / biotin---[acetyl-CoA-carboxylase] ligase
MNNQLTFPILRILADGRFHSGESLAQQFNVTRTTIWSAIQYAESLGVQIFSVRGKGYKLPQALQLLNHERVLTAIGEQRAWFKLELHDTLESTNSTLMKKAAQGAPHASCVTALIQTKGKGRRGRAWQAGLGASLTFSLLWRFQCGASALSGLSLAVGVAMIRALHAVGLTQARLKWPNDVLVPNQQQQAQKLAGILIELQGDMEGPSAAIIGIGLNLDLPESTRQQIDQVVTDIKSELQQAIDPSLMLGLMLKHLADVLSVFEQQGFEALRDEWLAWHYFQGKTVKLVMPDGRDVQGVVQGVASDGILLVETAAGIQRFSSGEISMRGVSP